MLQIVTGILLALHYTSDLNSAYCSVFFLIREVFMDGVYIIFIHLELHLYSYFFFYILQELYSMVHIFIILILGFLELYFSSY